MFRALSLKISLHDIFPKNCYLLSCFFRDFSGQNKCHWYPGMLLVWSNRAELKGNREGNLSKIYKKRYKLATSGRGKIVSRLARKWESGNTITKVFENNRKRERRGERERSWNRNWKMTKKVETYLDKLKRVTQKSYSFSGKIEHKCRKYGGMMMMMKS